MKPLSTATPLSTMVSKSAAPQVAIHLDDGPGLAPVDGVPDRSHSLVVDLGPTGRHHDAMASGNMAQHAQRCTRIGIASRHRLDLAVGSTVLPHRAIVPTECPGTLLMERLRAWRAGDGRTPTSAGFYRVKRGISAARVRTGPGREHPVALDGLARMWPGDLIDADRVVEGESIAGEKRWVHRRDGQRRGFALTGRLIPRCKESLAHHDASKSLHTIPYGQSSLQSPVTKM
jgi:hypothetical protein